MTAATTPPTPVISPTTTPATPEVADDVVDFDDRKFETQEDFSKALFKEILDRSGLDSFGDVPIPKRAVWEDPGGSLMNVELNQSSPFDKKSVVMGLFHDDEEVRVYTLPAEKGEAKRYCLSKRGRTFVVETFSSLEMIIDSLAEEYNTLGIANEVIDDDDDDDDEAANGVEIVTHDISPIPTVTS
jgi:hypothetical protein